MTVNEIKFIETKFAEKFHCSVLDVFGSLRRAVGPNTEKLLKIVFRHDGYIAGGFGIVVARHAVSDKPIDWDLFEDSIVDHIGTLRINEIGKVTSLVKAGKGDIDVWFPNNEQLSAFMNDPERLEMWNENAFTCEPTITGTALEHIVDDRVRVQVIKQFLMPMQEQLSRFDIYNSMVGITNDTITVPENWKKLESSRTLHVHDWKASKWTINRLFKYMNRKGYRHVSSETADRLAQEVVNTLEWHAEHKDELDNMTSKNIDELNLNKLKKTAVLSMSVLKLIRKFLPSMNNDDLLLLSALLDQKTDYNYALQEFLKRGMKE